MTHLTIKLKNPSEKVEKLAYLGYKNTFYFDKDYSDESLIVVKDSVVSTNGRDIQEMGVADPLFAKFIEQMEETKSKAR